MEAAEGEERRRVEEGRRRRRRGVDAPELELGLGGSDEGTCVDGGVGRRARRRAESSPAAAAESTAAESTAAESTAAEEGGGRRARRRGTGSCCEPSAGARARVDPQAGGLLPSAAAERSAELLPAPLPAAEEELLPAASARPKPPPRRPLPPVSSVFAQAEGGEFFCDAPRRAAPPPPPPPPPAAASPGLPLARALFSLVLAPSVAAPGLLAGVAALEAAVHVQSFDQPLPPVLLYQPAALHFYRAFLWLAFAALVGTWLRARRGASPAWAVWVYALLVLLYVSTAAITFGMRELDWDFSAASSREDDPYFLRIALLPPPAGALDAARFEAALTDSYASRVVRALLCWAAALLAALPIAHPPPAKRRAASPAAAVAPDDGRPADGGLHVLYDPASAFSSSSSAYSSSALASPAFASPSFAIAFWAAGATPPRPRAPDGGPPLAPLGAHEMRREAYSRGVCGCACALCADLLLASLVDTLHYDNVIPGWSSGRTKAFVLDIVQMVLALLVRVVFEGCFLAVIFQTAHFKLGRHSELWKDFGATLKTHVVCFFILLATRLFRMIRSFSNKTSGPNEHRFWWGAADTWIYVVLVVANGLMTLVFYVLSIDALRRLARPVYYLHPERARERGMELSVYH